MRLYTTIAASVTGILLGIPIAYALMIVALAYIILFVPFGFISTPEQIFDAGSALPLLSLPLFMLLGEIASEGGLARRITNFAGTLVGHWRGGVGHVSVVANAGMAGVSGSEAADIAALGRLFIPGMARKGYGRAYASALVSAGAVMGPIIPPSIPLIIYGSLAGVPIGELFMGGVIPGLMLGLTVMTAHGLAARRRGLSAEPRAKATHVARAGAAAAPIMVLPIVIVGGIVTGMVTATEAGGIAAIAAILLGFVYRDLTVPGIGRALVRFVETLGPLMLIISTAGIFSLVLTLEQTGPRLVEGVSPLIDVLGGHQWSVLLVLIGSIVILGCFIESMTLLIVLGPILTQVATSFGVDPVHFGVCFVVAVLLGTVTPPLGYALMVGARVGRVEQDAVIKEMLQFIPLMLGVLVLLILFPDLVTFLPDRLID